MAQSKICKKTRIQVPRHVSNRALLRTQLAGRGRRGHGRAAGCCCCSGAARRPGSRRGYRSDRYSGLRHLRFWPPAAHTALRQSLDTHPHPHSAAAQCTGRRAHTRPVTHTHTRLTGSRRHTAHATTLGCFISPVPVFLFDARRKHVLVVYCCHILTNPFDFVSQVGT
jgi:hypothetical protein